MKNTRCTGCGACVNICPHNAIKMNISNEGFSYPVREQEKCTECMLCEKVCHIYNKEEAEQLNILGVYAMKSNDLDIRMNSTSGGIFSELAKVILGKNGYIVGAAYNEDWTVSHLMINSVEDMKLLRRSKYQQSNIEFVFREVKDKLVCGKTVLFVGTPCQIGGLKRFLGKTYENLVLCDFVCIGVQSPKLFQKYLQQLNQKYTSKITGICMKSKRIGWHDLTTIISFEDGSEYIKSGHVDSYMQFMIKHHIGLRDSCYECQFKGQNSEADITLGDFWGIEDMDIDDNIGTSLVISRTEKGKNLVEKIKEECQWRKMDIGLALKGNYHLGYSVKRGKVTNEELFDMIKEYGYIETFNRVDKCSGKRE